LEPLRQALSTTVNIAISFDKLADLEMIVKMGFQEGFTMGLGQLEEELLRFRVLDPACGCGNFLYIAYRELRRLEEASAARYTDVVVFPTPPFSAAVTMIMNRTYPVLSDFRRVFGVAFEHRDSCSRPM